MTTITPSTLAFIGNFGGGEIILIFLIVLLLFGAKKVPELFRSLGKGVNEFRKAKNDWEQDIQDVMNQEPLEDHDFDQKSSTSEDTEKVKTEGEKQTASESIVPASQNWLKSHSVEPFTDDLALITLYFHLIISPATSSS